MEKFNDLKNILKLAGKLAETCHRVCGANTHTLSLAVQMMESALHEYDNAVMDLLRKENDDEKIG